MFKKFISAISIFILISSCSDKEEKKLLMNKKKEESKESMAREVKYWNDMFYKEEAEYKRDSSRGIYESKNDDIVIETILGDYNGDGKTETAFISPKSGYINFFPGNLGNVTELGKLDPKNSKLINEGDLNNDGADDFSVYTDFGDSGTINTFMYNSKQPWKVSISIILKKGEKVGNKDIEKRVFQEDGQIYYLEDEYIEDVYMLRDAKFKNRLIRKNVKNYKSN